MKSMNVIKKVVVAILTLEAKLVLRRYNPKIIAVTGSVGKTTTKDAIFASLSGHLYIRKNEKSMNSDFGVPLAIVGCETGWHDPIKWIKNIVRGLMLIVRRTAYPEWLVLEVGADRPGDISSIARWLRPDIAVITLVPEIPAHVEFFDSPEDVLREKRSLAEHLKPGGKLIVYGDDPRLHRLSGDFHGATSTFGFEPHNDYVATNDEIAYESELPTGVRFHANHGGRSIAVSIRGSLGRPRVYAALAAIAVADCVGVDGAAAAEGIAAWPPSPGRMRLVPGVRGSIIIDDTYNSSPAAALAALETLDAVQGKRKIAVLGDMLELGKYSADAHRAVGTRAAEVADRLVTIGIRARGIGEAALDGGMRDDRIFEYEHGESERAGKELRRAIKKGDVILVKGSQSMRMERTVFELMEEPQKAPEYLVRQEVEWLAKA